MGKKLISKNDLTPALTSFSFEVALKNKKKSVNDFRKVSVVQDLERGVGHDSSFEKSEMELRPRTSNFSTFLLI